MHEEANETDESHGPRIPEIDGRVLHVDGLLRERANRRWPKQGRALRSFFGASVPPQSWLPPDSVGAALLAFGRWLTTYRRPQLTSISVVESVVSERDWPLAETGYFEARASAVPSMYIVRDHSPDGWLMLEDALTGDLAQLHHPFMATMIGRGHGVGGFIVPVESYAILHPLSPVIPPVYVSQCIAFLRAAGFGERAEGRAATAHCLGHLWAPGVLDRPARGRRARPRTPPRLKDAPGKTAMLEIEVSLVDIKPRIWRRFLIARDATFLGLHEAIQKAFGWGNYHLFEFRRRGRRGALIAGQPEHDAYGDGDMPDARRVVLRSVLAKVGARCTYTYDFGDDWEHDVRVRDVRHVDGVALRRLVAGRRACPPEDCGGVPGYARCADFVLRRSEARDHGADDGDDGDDGEGDESESLAGWLPDGWHPDRFDLDKARTAFDL